MLAAILVSAAACGNDASPATTAAATDAAPGATTDAAADSSGDTGTNGSADTAAGTQQAADSSLADTADAKPMDTANSSDSAAQTDAASSQDSSADGAAGDMSADTSLCPAPKPPGTVCEGSSWVCAPGYFHNYGNSVCLEATCANMKAALDAALAEVEAKTHGCSGADEGECVVVPTTTACQGSCGVAVNGGMANDVALAVGWVDEHICKAFAFADKCGYSTPKCMAPAPACVDGVCVYKP